MQLLCHHPVAVRWRPPRIAGERHALVGVRTPVEIPEAARAPEPVKILADGSLQHFFLHEGAVYDRMICIQLDKAGSGYPADRELLARSLGGPRPVPGLFFSCVTPLRSSRVIEGFAGGSGEDIPERILALRTGVDNTEAVRSGLADYVSRTFLLHDRSVYALARPQTITPHAYNKTGPASDGIFRRGYGLNFVGARLGEMDRYLRHIDYRGAKGAITGMIRAFNEENDMTRVQPDTDLDLWINEAPWYAERLTRSEIGRAGLDGIDLSTALAHADRLRPFVDLGLVGAIPREDYALVAEILGNTIDALRAALPDRHTQPPLTWLKAYNDIVAKPSIGLAPVPDADLDDLIGLAPGGMPGR